MEPGTLQTTPREGRGQKPLVVRLLVVLAVLTTGLGIWFWTADLSADPPRYYSALGQAVLTDPANVVYHARNEVLFGEADPFGYGRWIVFRRSLMSIVTRAWGAMVGISYAKANAAAIALNLTALALLLLGMAGRHRPWTLWAVVTVWLMNATLLVYGRLPFLENGLLALAALSFLVYSRWGNLLWGMAAAAGLIAVATAMGKLFGALLLPALLLAIYVSGCERRGRNMLIAAAAYAGGLALMLVVLYGGQLGTVFGYVGEQAYGLRGFPEGLESPWAFVEHLMTYGAGNRLYYLTPDLLLFLVGGGLALVLLAPWRERSLPRTTVFAVTWTVCVVGGLMPLNYSPLRYALLLFPAIFTGCFGLLDHLLREGQLSIPRLGRVRAVFAGLLIWYLLIHVTGMSLARLQLSPRLLTWTTLPVALLVTWGLSNLIWKKQPVIRQRWIITTAAVLLGFSVATNGLRIAQTQLQRRSHNLVDDSRELEQILGPDAVLSGPYGPVLATETRLKSFIHMFGVSKPDPDLFKSHPITHLAVDEANYAEAVEVYPALGGVQALASYWIAGWQVKLYDISDRFDNPIAQRYVPTDFERAVKALQRGQVDGAVSRLQTYLMTHSLTKSPGTLLTELLLRQGEAGRALQTITELAQDYPDDFIIQLQRGRLYYMAGRATGDRAALDQAEAAFRTCLKIDPTKRETIDRVKYQVDQRSGGKR